MIPQHIKVIKLLSYLAVTVAYKRF